MPGFALGIRYLTGYAVATDPTSREAAEWPPHPGRVFMALAAAHFESGGDPGERATLEWLEALGPPSLSASDADPRSVVTCFVPVNDEAGPSKATLQSAPQLTRDRAGRTFPCVRPHDDTVYLIWHEAIPPERKESLVSLCAKVARIGHSSSLVQMWYADSAQQVQPSLVPTDDAPELSLRQVSAGTLSYLQQQFNRQAADMYARLSLEITTTKGKAQREARAEFQRAFGVEWRKSLPPPSSRRPVLSVWQGYRRLRPPDDEPSAHSCFDPSLVVMRLEAEDSPYQHLDLATTLRLTDVLRRAALRVALDDLRLEAVPEVLSGHQPNGAPTERPHAAYLPLAFVGRPHASGHLLGVAVALPLEEHWPERRQERPKVMATLARIDRLTLGPLGVWRLVPESREAPEYALVPRTWTAFPRGQLVWASVTPVAFDKHPKDRDRGAYMERVITMVRKACERIGLPEPTDVQVTAISRHLGAPAAREYPCLRRKDGSERRHAHVVLRFPRPVIGPVILGAGRYRGYGVCRPVADSPEMAR